MRHLRSSLGSLVALLARSRLSRRASQRTLSHALLAGHGTDAAALRRMPLEDFAVLCRILFGAEGYETTFARPTVDGGVDLELRAADGGRALAYCRQWSEDLVGRPFLQRVVGDVGTARAELGVVLTTTGFTAEAQAFAEAHPLRLVDARDLERFAATRLVDPQ